MKWNGAVRARVGYAYDRVLPYIGGGVEYAVTEHLILRAEYRYTNFGNKTFHNLVEVDVNKIKLSTHDFRVGLAYKF